MKRILITGAAGYIGSRLSRYFCQDYGTPVVVYDMTRPSSQSPYAHDYANAVDHHNLSVDLSDHAAIDAVIKDVRPDVVVHAAGVTPMKQHDDHAFQKENIDNSLHLLSCLQSAKAEGYDPIFIFASSVSVYGVPMNDKGYVRETDVPNPQNIYARSKVAFEEALEGQNIIRYGILRYSNIPGKDTLINAVLKNKKVTFLGPTFFQRDYIHLDDLCDLHGHTVDHLLSGGQPIKINAGSGCGYSFMDIIDEIEAQANIKIERIFEENNENGVVRLICDMQRAMNILDWTPKRTRIEDIVAYALENSEFSPQATNRHYRRDRRSFIF